MAVKAPRTLTRQNLLALAAILVVAAAVRFIGINYPPKPMVDEAWYARDGCYYWKGSAEACGMGPNVEAPDRDIDTWLATYRELTPEHPPLAKWLIGAPMAVTCYCPTAWRLASIGAGLATIALLFLLILQLLGSRLAAIAGAALLAIDFPHLIHSRIGMLDIFVGFFAVAAFYCCVRDREQIRRRVEGLSAHVHWRAAAGMAGGAAAACKLSGAAVVVGVLVLTVAWEVAAVRRDTLGEPRLVRRIIAIVGPLVMLPAITYAATYVGRLDGTLFTAPWADGAWVRAFVERQLYILDFHAARPAGPDPPWILPMTKGPVTYLLERTDEGLREVLLFGNPVLWWGGFAAVVYAVVRWIRNDDRPATAVVVVGFLAAYAGWLTVSLRGNPVHFFYAVPAIPFLYLAIAAVIAKVESWRPSRAIVAGGLAAAALACVFYLPILIALPVSDQDWRLRACSAQLLWLEPVDCATVLKT
jgi:dolichyl-phosphate-mannose--protein O-mannosyl transferase